MIENNRICYADSYKYSQPKQMPKDTTSMYDYMEARGGMYDKVTFFGFQMIMKNHFTDPIEQWEVDEARDIAEAHGEPFEYEGWTYIVQELGGKLPLKIKAIPEGKSVPTSVPLMTIESTDEKVYWVVSWFETFVMKVWYPTTVASRSKSVIDTITPYLEKTADTTDGIGFKYHDFADRGCTSVESAAIAGVARLTQSMGTDNFNALRYAKEFYGIDMAGFSIPASEHSTVTSWGKDGEFDMYENYIEVFKDRPIIACVMDSYNIYEAVDYVTKGSFKEKIESDDYPVFVLRPDSGKPTEVLSNMITIMERNGVKYHINEKGYRVFNKYAIIWGDGVTEDNIKEMLDYVTDRGYSADIIAFGSGGWGSQALDRDTSRFAVKCSSITVNGVERDVFKDPITDKGKTSKKGRVSSFYNFKEKRYFAGTLDEEYVNAREALIEVWKDGEFTKTYTFDEVRENTKG